MSIKLCQVQIDYTIFAEILKIHSGLAHLFGQNNKLAVLTA